MVDGIVEEKFIIPRRKQMDWSARRKEVWWEVWLRCRRSVGLVLKCDLVPEVECGQPGMGHGKGVSIIFLLRGIHG